MVELSHVQHIIVTWHVLSCIVICYIVFYIALEDFKKLSIHTNNLFIHSLPMTTRIYKDTTDNNSQYDNTKLQEE